MTASSSANPHAAAAPFAAMRWRPDLAHVLSAGLFIAIIGLWQASVRLGWVPAFVLPAPSDVVIRLAEDVMLPRMQSDALYTLTEILAGFAIAAVIGVSLGALVALVPLADRVLSPYIVAFQTIPKVAVAPLLVIWLGFGIESKICIVALIVFFPILVNAVAGFRSTDPRQLLLMKSLRASAWQVFRKVRLPNAMPYLMAGVHIAMIFALIGAVVGEFLGSSQGLGSQIIQRQSAMDVVGVFSVLVILSVIGISLNVLTKLVGRRLVFWSSTEEPAGL